MPKTKENQHVLYLYKDEIYLRIDAFNPEVVGNVYENPELLEKLHERE